MRRLLFALLLAVAPAAYAQTSACGTNPDVTLTPGQEFRQMADVINKQTACIHELQARIVSLEHDLPIVARVVNDIIFFGRDQICRFNFKVPGWVTTLTGLEALPLGSYICPNPMPAQAAPTPTPIIFAE